jgi:hypothetical protein
MRGVDGRCHKLSNLYRIWSCDKRHALKRDLDVRHGESVLTILERLQEMPRKKKNGATLYETYVKERTTGSGARI